MARHQKSSPSISVASFQNNLSISTHQRFSLFGLQIICLFLFVGIGFSQSNPAAGVRPFATQVGGSVDSLDLTTGNVTLQIPVRAKAGKMPFSYSLVGNYGAFVWNQLVNGRNVPYWGTLSGLNGQPNSSLLGAAVNYSSKLITCGTDHADLETYNYTLTDSTGAVHAFNNPPIDVDGCTTPSSVGTTTDGTGYTLQLPSQTVSDRSGNVLDPLSVNPRVSDPDGTAMTLTNSPTFTYTDTLGVTALTANQTRDLGTLTTYTYNFLGGDGSNHSVAQSPSLLPVKTVFGCTGINDIGGWNSNYLASQITTPDGNYTLSYEPTPGNPGHYTGRLAKITLPTGGYVSYTYSGGNNGVNCTSHVVPTLTRTVNDNNGNSGTWTYVNSNTSSSPSATYTVTVTDPSSNVTVYHFIGTYQTEKQVYQGPATGTPLLTQITCYNGNFTNCPAPSFLPNLPITQTDVYTSLNSSSSALTETKYNSTGTVAEVKKYDFGAAMPPSGSPVSDTTISYGSWNGSSCIAFTNYIYDHPCVVTTVNSSGATVSQTKYTYNSNGHPTQVSKLVGGSTFLTSSATYNANGTMATSTDVNGASTTYTYGDCNGLLLTSVAEPLSLSTSSVWDCNGGVPTSSTDENGNVTHYSYDSMWRLTTAQFPDGGQTTTSYNLTSSPPNITINQLMDSSGHSVMTQTNLDGLGRAVRKMLTSDPAGIVYFDTAYNNLGQISCVKNPYRSSGDPTYGSTCSQYDALGRATTITNPDATTRLMTYTNRAVEVQDEGNGTSRVAKVFQNDGLGRLNSACEVSSASQMGNGGTPAACGLDIAATGFLTTYTYNALGNLLSVAQPGVTNRSYQYDELSRLTQSYDPEIGSTISYNYDSCSAGDLCSRTAPKPNQTGSATVTTSYNYDLLHRLGGKTYSDGITNSVVFLYDQTAPWGWNISNPKGNLTEEYTATSSGAVTEQMFERDSMGRLIETGSCTPINCSGNAYHFVYTYDLLGDILAENNDRESVTYTSSYNTAAQLTSFQSSLVNSTHPATLFTVNQYNPLGEIQQSTFGNGIVRNATYDNRGRISSQTDGSIYSFSLGLASDSNVLTGNDSVNGNWTYTYDGFNRLATSTQASGSAFNYQYDRFGNRWQQNVTAGGGPGPSYTFDAGNRTPSFLYDAAGNIINDGTHTYTYDAEGHMLTVDGGSTATYVYDASGQRVEETVNGGAPIDFIYDQQGHMVTEATASIWDRSELYAGGTHVALYANGTTYFMHTDWLGSTKNQSDMSGNSAQWCSYLPFADGFSCPGSQITLMSFTGDQWDGETGLSHTLFRQYNPTQGRWMTPDPSGMAAADPTNPQSWNRYAYVMNNPLNAIDPLGLQSFGPFFSGVGLDQTSSTCNLDGLATYCGVLRALVDGDGINYQFMLHATYFGNGQTISFSATCNVDPGTGNTTCPGVSPAPSTGLSPYLTNQAVAEILGLDHVNPSLFAYTSTNMGIASVNPRISLAPQPNRIGVTRPPVTPQQASNLCELATKLRNNGQPLNGHSGDPMVSLDESTSPGNALQLFAIAVSMAADYQECMHKYFELYH